MFPKLRWRHCHLSLLFWWASLYTFLFQRKIFLIYPSFMMTSSNGHFSALLTLCARSSPVTGEFPPQKPVTRNFDVFFDLRLNKLLSTQSRHRWFETPWRALWRHCNVELTNTVLSGYKYSRSSIQQPVAPQGYGSELRFITVGYQLF